MLTGPVPTGGQTDLPITPEEPISHHGYCSYSDFDQFHLRLGVLGIAEPRVGWPKLMRQPLSAPIAPSQCQRPACACTIARCCVAVVSSIIIVWGSREAKPVGSIPHCPAVCSVQAHSAARPCSLDNPFYPDRGLCGTHSLDEASARP